MIACVLTFNSCVIKLEYVNAALSGHTEWPDAVGERWHAEN